jgi:hypothetical protein
MADATTMSRQELEAKIVRRCWENEAFRQEFTGDPKAAFAKYLQLPAASMPDVVVHEEPPGTWHIVLRARPDTAGQLSDAELEQIAGGTSPIVVGGILMAVGVPVAYIAGATSQDGGW